MIVESYDITAVTVGHIYAITPNYKYNWVGAEIGFKVKTNTSNSKNIERSFYHIFVTKFNPHTCDPERKIWDIFRNKFE